MTQPPSPQPNAARPAPITDARRDRDDPGSLEVADTERECPNANGGTATASDCHKPVNHLKSTKTWLIFLCLAGLLAYLPMFVSLASSSGPGSYYSHWFLIPPVGAVLIWMKKDKLVRCPVEGSGLGLAIAGVSLLLHCFAVWFRVDFVSAFSFVVVIWGLALYFLGKRIVREAGFPLLFLVFMVPLPGAVIAPIAFHMKILSGKAAVAIYNFLGGTAILTGSKISFVQAEPLWMGYECSGLKSVISLSALGAIVAYLVNLSLPRKVLLFLCSFPLATFSNALRVTSLCFAAERWSVKSKAFKVFHDASSPVVFLIVLAGLVGFYRLLAIGRAPTKLHSAGARHDSSSGDKPFLALIPRKKLRIVFVLLCVSSVLVLGCPHSMPAAGKMSALRPVDLPESVGEWKKTETDQLQREEVFSILKTRSVALDTYRSPSGNEVAVLVVASDTDRQAFHPPEICMIGAGNEVLGKWKESVVVNSRDARDLHVNAFIRGTGGRPDTLVFYWYMAGERSTGGRTLQQLTLLLNGARKIPMIGAMVRVTVPLATMTREEAVESAKEFVSRLVPLMPGVLEAAR